MLEHVTAITVAVFVVWLAAICQAVFSFASCVKLWRFVRAALAAPPTGYQPPAAIILPCCGLDNRLADTVAALRDQDYPDYEVVFVFESTDDPAYSAVGAWAADWQSRKWRRVVAGLAEHCSQKVHNLLAAAQTVGDDRVVMAFLDSDAIPARHWLRELVSPLADPKVGAATGFRWYSAAGGFADAARSGWNAASLLFVHNPRLNFCWGGSTAIRRETFIECRVPQRWAGALSDDYQMTRVIREAGLQIRFVPKCLIPCHESTGFIDFVRFARRQLIITRVCGPRLWRHAMFLAVNYMTGTTATFAYAMVQLWIGHIALGVTFTVLWLMLLWTVKGASMLRQSAVALVLPPPAWTRRDWMADVMGSELLGLLHTALLLSSARTRTIAWRGTVYEMVSADSTRVVSRAGVPVQHSTTVSHAPSAGVARQGL